LLSADSAQKFGQFLTGFCLKFNLGKSTCFKVISQAFSDIAKVWFDTGENMLNSWLMNLQISQGKYTLFSANFFVGLRALSNLLKGGENFGLAEEIRISLEI